MNRKFENATGAAKEKWRQVIEELKLKEEKEEKKKQKDLEKKALLDESKQDLAPDRYLRNDD